MSSTKQAYSDTVQGGPLKGGAVTSRPGKSLQQQKQDAEKRSQGESVPTPTSPTPEPAKTP